LKLVFANSKELTPLAFPTVRLLSYGSVDDSLLEAIAPPWRAILFRYSVYHMYEARIKKKVILFIFVRRCFLFVTIIANRRNLDEENC